jgi:hypothetical protein
VAKVAKKNILAKFGDEGAWASREWENRRVGEGPKGEFENLKMWKFENVWI